MSEPVRPKFKANEPPLSASASPPTAVAAAVVDRANLALEDVNDQQQRIETLRSDQDRQIEFDDVHIVAPAFAEWVPRYQQAQAKAFPSARRDGALVGAALGGAMGLWHATKGGGDTADIVRFLLFCLAGGAAVGTLGGSAVQSLAAQRAHPVPETVPDDALAWMLTEHLGWSEPSQIVEWRVRGLRDSWAIRARQHNVQNCAHVTPSELMNGMIALKRVVR